MLGVPVHSAFKSDSGTGGKPTPASRTAKTADGERRREKMRGVKHISARSKELSATGKGMAAPIATDSEGSDLFQISSITMCGRGEETT